MESRATSKGAVAQSACFTDVLFFALVAAGGFAVDALPLVTVAVHLVTSLLSGLVLTFTPSGDSSAREKAAVCACACATLASLTDALFVFHHFTEDGPSNFAYGARSDDPIVATALVATHATSFFAAGYRLRRFTADLEVDAGFTSLGISIAASFVYVAWLTDLLGSSGRVLYAHFLGACVLFVVNVVDLILVFASQRTRRRVWLIAAAATVVQYLFLVSNVSVLLGDLSFGDDVLNFLTHHYASDIAKAQAVVITLLSFSATAYRSVATAPEEDWRVEEGEPRVRVKTPASTAEVEWFSAFVVGAVYFASTVFPTVSYVVVFFGDRTPNFSRFAVLLYVTLLTLRFWIQARAVQVSMFVTASVVGIITDCAVVLDTFLLNEGYVLHARGDPETVVVTSVASGSAFVSALCLIHSAVEYAKTRSLKMKSL